MDISLLFIAASILSQWKLFNLQVSKKGGRSYERMFYLFSDMLMYAKPRLLDAGSAHQAYTCCCVFPLQHCHVTRVFGHSAGQGALFSVSLK